ncbi:MAG: hypothetical protein K1X88_34550 [Nannocystaceae bacterium]|nr:hypothetical protein [Nannocystaceae bacterium]
MRSSIHRLVVLSALALVPGLVGCEKKETTNPDEAAEGGGEAAEGGGEAAEGGGEAAEGGEEKKEGGW